MAVAIFDGCKRLPNFLTRRCGWCGFARQFSNTFGELLHYKKNRHHYYQADQDAKSYFYAGNLFRLTTSQQPRKVGALTMTARSELWRMSYPVGDAENPVTTARHSSQCYREWTCRALERACQSESYKVRGTLLI